ENHRLAQKLTMEHFAFFDVAAPTGNVPGVLDEGHDCLLEMMSVLYGSCSAKFITNRASGLFYMVRIGVNTDIEDIIGCLNQRPYTPPATVQALMQESDIPMDAM